jgi:acetyl-CoA carboxylase biotin carboxyl carrier protein
MSNKEKTTSKVKHTSYADYTAFIKDLAKIVKDAQLTEVEFKENDLQIKITKTKEAVYAQAPMAAMPQAMMAHMPAPQEVVPVSTASAPKVAAQEDYSKHEGAVLSPMVGVVYTSPNPDAPNFIKEGSSVKKGDTLVLIEAMKVFNPIKATKDGKVVKVLVKSNQAVEFNQVLVVIE